MTDAAVEISTRDIVVDEVFPHAPAIIWRTLTTPELMGRWLMPPTGFQPLPGTHFTYQTTPEGKWDGVIHCRVLEAKPNEKLVYEWKGGDAANAGYGSRLDTVVTVSLTQVDGGTRVKLVHSGFRVPDNDFAYGNMSNGWPVVLAKIGTIAGEPGEARQIEGAWITRLDGKLFFMNFGPSSFELIFELPDGKSVIMGTYAVVAPGDPLKIDLFLAEGIGPRGDSVRDRKDAKIARTIMRRVGDTLEFFAPPPEVDGRPESFPDAAPGLIDGNLYLVLKRAA